MGKKQPASSPLVQRTARKSRGSSVETRGSKIVKKAKGPTDAELAAMTDEQLAAIGYTSMTLEESRAHAKTPEFASRMGRLAATPEAEIDDSEIPPLSDRQLASMVRADQYRPLKRTVTIRFDADVLAWLKSKGGPYQTKLNAMLRSQMLREAKR